MNPRTAMRNNFKQALLEIILGPFTNTNALLWSAYKQHLRPIIPAVLPTKIQPIFEELKYIYESRFEANLNRRQEWWDNAELVIGLREYTWWRNNQYQSFTSGWHEKRKPTGQEIYQQTLDDDLMHNTQHVTAKRIKELMFEILEKLPKR